MDRREFLKSIGIFGVGVVAIPLVKLTDHDKSHEADGLRIEGKNIKIDGSLILRNNSVISNCNIESTGETAIIFEGDSSNNTVIGTSITIKGRGNGWA